MNPPENPDAVRNADAAGNADVPVGSNNGCADEDVGAPQYADEDVGAPQYADEDVGAPGAPRGWYSRGYLPHCDAPRLIQSVTFRLADSLPQTTLVELQEELKDTPEAQRDAKRRKRIEAWLDAGLGCCALAHPDVAQYVQNALLHFYGVRYRLHAWCIMPNHVHTLVEPLVDLARIIQGWKSYTARWILKKNEPLGLKIPRSDQVWMREYWDRYIRDAGHYESVVGYIHQNPVKPGLCQGVEAWPWSSAFPGNADVLIGNNTKDA